MRVIMLGGKAGAGKDTFCKVMQSKSLGVVRFAFADALKEIAKSFLWDGKKDTKGRRLLQQIGAVGREYDKDIWANKVVEAIKNFEYLQMPYLESHYGGEFIAVITDFRFPNEYEVIKRNFDNVKTYKIVGRQAYLGENAKDVSETSLDNFQFDGIIDNSSYKSSLVEKAKQLLSEG